MNLYEEAYALTHSYVRKGGKRNRNQQRKRMLAFVKFARQKGVNSIGQLGRKHVIQYWKDNSDLSDATLYSHWLAIKVLWDLSGKTKLPPKPRKIGSEYYTSEQLIEFLLE